MTIFHIIFPMCPSKNPQEESSPGVPGVPSWGWTFRHGKFLLEVERMTPPIFQKKNTLERVVWKKALPFFVSHRSSSAKKKKKQGQPVLGQPLAMAREIHDPKKPYVYGFHTGLQESALEWTNMFVCVYIYIMYDLCIYICI